MENLKNEYINKTQKKYINYMQKKDILRRRKKNMNDDNGYL